MSLFIQNRTRVTDVGNKHGYQEGKGEEINWEIGIDIYELLYICCCSVTQLCLTPSFPVLYSLLEFAQTHVHWVDDASSRLILCLLLLLLPSIFLSIRVFSNESALCVGGQSIRASASASVLPMNIQNRFPFRIDWFDLLAVQGTLKSLLQLCIKQVTNKNPLYSSENSIQYSVMT